MKIFKKMISLYYYFVCKSQCSSVKNCTKINARSKLTSNTIIESNAHFNGMHISGVGMVKIGNNFHSGHGCRIITQFHNYDSGQKIPYDESYIVKDVIIGDNVWLGESVMILGGVTIGEGAIVQAGSVVVKDIPPYAIAGGHPATTFKSRNIEHYKKLKALKRFH